MLIKTLDPPRDRVVRATPQKRYELARRDAEVPIQIGVHLDHHALPSPVRSTAREDQVDSVVPVMTGVANDLEVSQHKTDGLPENNDRLDGRSVFEIAIAHAFWCSGVPKKAPRNVVALWSQRTPAGRRQ